MKKRRPTIVMVVIGIALSISVIVLTAGFVNYHKSSASNLPTTPVTIDEPSQEPKPGAVEDLPEEPEMETILEEEEIPLPEAPIEKEPETIHTISRERQKMRAPDDLTKLEYDVPFTTQAPGAKWDNPVLQDGCEEASVLMGMMWINGQEKISKSEAEKKIIDLADHAREMFGESLDLSTQDTTFLIRDYYDHEHVYYFEDITTKDIIDALYRGSTVILAVNGKRLQNPNFKNGGPENHMLIVSGYDPKKEEFITNDPGTRKGEDYRYSRDTIEASLRDYPTGFHAPNPTVEKKMIELWK